MKPTVVIVGAGLGGCFLADALAEHWDVTVVELGSHPDQLQQRVRDVGKAAITRPHIGSGPGGSTVYWHNGLIEIEEEIFQRHWPFQKSVLAAYYSRAFQKLSGTSPDEVAAATDTLREKLSACGIPETMLRHSLYYPRRRINAWKELRLEGRVKLLTGEVVGIATDDTHAVRQVRVKTTNGEIELGGDVFVLAAGGLGTPLLLQGLARSISLPALSQAGMNYEDHPSGFVAEFVMDAPIYKFWNLAVPRSKGHLRFPLVVKQDGLLISFQIRPAVQFGPRNKVVSILSDLRNRPFHLPNYFRLLTHLDDILDILSMRFGIQLPTRHYSLLMVAEQPPASGCCVWREEHDQHIIRKWELSGSYLASLQKAIDQALHRLGGVIGNIRVFPDWASNLFSSSHHSGAARMHPSPAHGTCDENGKVHGTANLYVCDGSAIPGSGYANTGLTIAALALRMADHLKEQRQDR